MRFKHLLLPLAALGMIAAPVAASAAQSANPAASLSVTRAAADNAGQSDLRGRGGAGLFGILLIAGIIAIVVIAVVNNDDNSNSTSP